MAKISSTDNTNNNNGNNGNNAADGKTIEQLQAEYTEAKQKIRALLSVKTDRKELTDKEKSDLRLAYIGAANIARQLSKRVNNAETQKGYEEDYKKLSQAAASYGSAMESKIPETTLDDVKGLHEVKRLIHNFIYIASRDDIMKRYRLAGGMGILMYGPPGTGKTMIAEAIANAMQLPLFIITPADIFKSYVGGSEQAVKAVFDEIERCEDGAILFVDECESIFSKRSQNTQDYKSAVTTELLQRMNGFGVNGSKRIMIAATNRPDAIDSAYLRFKRFSHQIYVQLPDAEAKKSIIEGKLPKGDDGKPYLADDCTLEWLLDRMCQPGMNYSAADICGIVESACYNAISVMRERNSPTTLPLTRDMFEKAITANPPRLSDEDLRMYQNFNKE